MLTSNGTTQHRLAPPNRAQPRPPASARARLKPPETACNRVQRWDNFAWPDVKLAVEVEGLTHGGGRHQTMDGYTRDCEKYNAAVLAGWRVLRFTQRQVYSYDAVTVIGEALA